MFTFNGISDYDSKYKNTIRWVLHKNRNDIIEKLYNSILNILNYKCNIIDKNNSKHIFCYNKCLANIFAEFNNKLDKHLPEKYYCKNTDYIQGLYDGLIDSNGTKEKYINNTVFRFDNTSKSNIELFYWCCLNLNISFSSSNHGKNERNLKGLNKNNLNDCFRIKTHTRNRFTKDFAYSYVKENIKTRELVETYDLEIDCETHSFIANNTIVHNSAYTTRKQTGVGYPQLSSVIECADACSWNRWFSYIRWRIVLFLVILVKHLELVRILLWLVVILPGIPNLGVI